MPDPTDGFQDLLVDLRTLLFYVLPESSSSFFFMRHVFLKRVKERWDKKSTESPVDEIKPKIYRSHGKSSFVRFFILTFPAWEDERSHCVTGTGVQRVGESLGWSGATTRCLHPVKHWHVSAPLMWHPVWRHSVDTCQSLIGWMHYVAAPLHPRVSPRVGGRTQNKE